MISKIYGDQFIKLLLAFRTLNIQGRLGGGKTLLSVWLAYWLMGMGKTKHIISNFPIVAKNDNEEDIKESVIILDESWMYITTRKSVISYAGFLRKLDNYLILPSVFDIQSRLSKFSCFRQYNLMGFGIPAWVYRWDLNGNRYHETGSFILTFPSRLYGIYDTRYIPADDGGINDRLSKTIGKLERTPGTKNSDNTIDIDDYRINLDDFSLDFDNGLQKLDERMEEFQELLNKRKKIR